MFRPGVLAAASLASVLVGGTALAASQTDNQTQKQSSAQPQTSQESAAQTTAYRDFGRVSKDGFGAMRDVSMARWAIFNGDTNGAKLDIQKANSALKRAQSDDSVFMKAESALTPPAGVTQPKAADNAQPSTQTVKWLPVDGAMALDEDYTASPAKSAGVSKANAQLKNGDHEGAMQTLKLAGVNISFDEAVVPLNATMAGVNKAETLLDSGEF